jgi:hypothetical protein
LLIQYVSAKFHWSIAEVWTLLNPTHHGQ